MTVLVRLIYRSLAVGADLGPPWVARPDSPLPADLGLALIETGQTGQHDPAIRECFAEGLIAGRLAHAELGPHPWP